MCEQSLQHFNFLRTVIQVVRDMNWCEYVTGPKGILDSEVLIAQVRYGESGVLSKTGDERLVSCYNLL